MTERRLRPILAAALVSCFFLGCEDSGSGGGSGTWNEPPKPTTTTQPAAKPAAPATTQPAAKKPAAKPASKTEPAPAEPAASGGDGDGSVGGDQAPFGSFKWTFGGKPVGSRARNGGVVISGARFSEGGVSFTYAKNLSAWGYADNALGGVACLFVQKSNGQWVGGKFDWISSSRKSRDFANVYGGYEGWSLAGVPNPCTAAFVIISPDGKRRSNAIVGTWRHR